MNGYFPHDENARNDQKVLKLRAKYGLEGYGLFWCILESMSTDSTGFIDGSSMAELSLSYGLAIEKISEMINFMIEVGLFKKCDHGNFYSERLLAHKNFRKERSISGKKGAFSKWNGSANGSAIKQPMASKVKESKVKKSKEKVNKDIPASPEVSFQTKITDLFFRLHEEYRKTKPVYISQGPKNFPKSFQILASYQRPLSDYEAVFRHGFEDQFHKNMISPAYAAEKFNELLPLIPRKETQNATSKSSHSEGYGQFEFERNAKGKYENI